MATAAPATTRAILQDAYRKPTGGASERSPFQKSPQSKSSSGCRQLTQAHGTSFAHLTSVGAELLDRPDHSKPAQRHRLDLRPSRTKETRTS